MLTSSVQQHQRRWQSCIAVDALVQGDDELLQLHDETAELLWLVKNAAKKLVRNPSAFAMQQFGKATSGGTTGHSALLVASPTAPSGNTSMTIEVADEDGEKNTNSMPGATHALHGEPWIQSNPALKDSGDALFTSRKRAFAM